MPVIEMNSGLEPELFTSYPDVTRFVDQHTDRKRVYITGRSVGKSTDLSWQRGTPHYEQSLFPVQENISGPERVYHANYLSYLELCWGRHLGAVLTPDIFWYMLLCELALLIAENPEKYRHLFTESQEKQTIIVQGDGILLPLDLIMRQLKQLVPAGFAEHFVHQFSTTDERALFAQQAAFADAVSPYYNYAMLACGIPRIRLEGTTADWLKIADAWAHITLEFPDEHEFFGRVGLCICAIGKQLTEPDPGFWNGMFRLERCGSGSQTEVRGWITELYRKPPKHTAFVSNFSPHISVVNYQHLTLQKDYALKVGLFSSRIELGTLVPQFGHMLYEKAKEPVVTPVDPPKVEAMDRGLFEKLAGKKKD